MKLTPLKNGQIIYGRHGREYKIRLVKFIKSAKETAEGYTTYAQIDRKKKIIRIRTDVEWIDQYMYLLHELLHDQAEDFEEYDLTKEIYIEFLTGDLFDCLRRNGLGFC